MVLNTKIHHNGAHHEGVLHDGAAETPAPFSSRELLRAIFQCAADAIFTKDTDGRYTSANKACCNIFGITQEELIGKKDCDLLPAKLVEAIEKSDRKVFGGESIRLYDNRSIGGKEYTFHIAKVPMLDGNGDIGGLCGIARDVTEQKRIEANLFDALRSEALMDLSADIAHEFNNIIFGITSYTTMAKMNLSEGTQAWNDLNEILKATEQAGTFTGRLMSLRYKAPERLKKIPMEEVVHGMANLLGRAFPPCCRVTVTGGSDSLVSIDREQVEWALRNICINARDAMPEGGDLTLEIGDTELTEEQVEAFSHVLPGPYCKLVIRDTGTGMPPEVLNRIFEPFFKRDPGSERTGLGLSLVYGILKEHGGAIRVESTVGSGTEVEVFLPVTGRRGDS